MAVKIGTLNSRGGDSKVLQIIDTFLVNKLDILALQEIHDMKPSNVREIELKTKSVCFTSPGSARGRGVMILFKESSTLHSPQLKAKDTDGNYISISYKINDKKMTFLNLYASNNCRERTLQFRKLNEIIEGSEDYLLGGDFNAIMDFKMDCIGKKLDNFNRQRQDRVELGKVQTDHGYVDTFRTKHPDLRLFTFTGLASYRARLDKIYIHNTMTDRVQCAEIIPVAFSDHDLYFIHIGSMDERPRWGHGLWKLNASLLENPEHLKAMISLWTNWQEQKSIIEDQLMYWEYGKRLVKSTLIDIGRKQQSAQKNERLELEALIREESKKLDPGTAAKIRDLKNRWNALEEQRLAGAAVRSRIDWQSKGEKSTKFFFSLERQNAEKKAIFVLKHHDKIYRNQEEIMGYIESHFRQHFSAVPIDHDACNRLIDSIDLRLDDVDMQNIQHLFTMAELETAHRKMKTSKAPGNDGITVEFYRKMWPYIKQDLLETINEIVLRNELPLSMTQGIVTLMYKNKGPRENIKSYRPLSMLNVDYKYMTSMITARLEIPMAKLTKTDQGCIKSRLIEDQLITLQNVYDYAAETGNKIMYNSQDLSSAFDFVDHEYLKKVLRRMNLGPMMEKLISTIYDNMYTAIQVNGTKTSYFRLSRSIRQGDPMASSVFVLSIEPLANIIRSNNKLHPVVIPNMPPKHLSQYCDDTNILSSCIKDFSTVTTATKLFENGSGAKFNELKAEVLLFGNWTEEERKQIPTENLRRNIKILGLWYGPDAKQLNQDHILSKVDAAIEFWQKIPLSFQGKKLIINTKILSQLYYTARITGLDRKFQKELQKRLLKFFWHPRKMYLLPFSTLQNDTQHGGIELPNLEVVNKAILTERICKILQSDRPWKGQLIYRCGFTLRHLDRTFASTRYLHTFKSTEVSAIIASTYTELKSKVPDWSLEDFKSLKQKLHQNTSFQLLDQRDWITINKCTRDRKERDLAYLIAHDCLTTKSLLKRRNVLSSDECNLCERETESPKHLFMDCDRVQELRMILERMIDPLNRKTLSEKEILYHETRQKMKQKTDQLIASYKSTIWTVRAKIYYGEIEKSAIREAMKKTFEHKTKNVMKM